MTETPVIPINEVDPKGIMRTISALISELGVFSAALILQDTAHRMAGEGETALLAETLAGDFPLYGELIGNGLSSSETEQIIEENSTLLSEELRSYSTFVVVGMESVILDRLCRKLPESRFFLIPHSEAIEPERVLANFPPNVSMIDVRGVMGLGGARSVLISYTFCRMGEDSFIYPVAYRAVGPDVRSLYNRIIGLNILTGYHRYLGDMAPLYSTSQFFTHSFSIL